MDYKGKRREFIVVFEIGGEIAFNEITLITIHPTRKEQKVNRIKSGRWVKVEVKL